MKKLLKLICLSVWALTLQNSFAQEPDSDYLKNYKAPDFRLRQLTVTGNTNGNGALSSAGNAHSFNLNAGLTYQQISNRKNYQGGIVTSYNNSSGYTRNPNVDAFAVNQSLTNNMFNRFYLDEKKFIGFHDQSAVLQSFYENSSDSFPEFSSLTLGVAPAISFGYGRVEYVQFARQAMDIERSLQQFNRLSSTYSAAGRTQVADKIAQIRNRRYYDIRLGRIDQLQALDSVFQAEGLTTEADIIYFSQLQDAFLYSYHMSRLSGFRHELGVTQGVRLSGTNGGATDMALNSYGFYSFAYYLPQSYAIQHNFNASVIGGMDSDNSSTIDNTFPVWADFSYTFGLYPTTRTYLAATVNSGMLVESGNVGYMYGAALDAYYYISPKFRLFGSARVTDGENYRSHNFSHVAVANSSRVLKVLDYAYRVGISYDIF